MKMDDQMISSDLIFYQSYAINHLSMLPLIKSENCFPTSAVHLLCELEGKSTKTAFLNSYQK